MYINIKILDDTCTFIIDIYYPRCSMYRIFTYIYHTFKPIVGQYSSPMEHMGNICMLMSIFYISGQIIIFHGSLGRISLFQI